MGESKIENFSGEDPDYASSVEDSYMDDCLALENIDMDGLYDFSGNGDTVIYWNLEDYPIPGGTDLGSIHPNIKRALQMMGFYGSTEIYGYADNLIYDRQELWKKVEIHYVAVSEHILGDKISAALLMPMDMIVEAAAKPPELASNFLVIAKQSPGSELHRVQQCLKSRNHTVLVLDDPPKQSLFLSAEIVAERIHLFGGGKPIIKRRLFRSDSEYKEYVSSLCQAISMCEESSVSEDIIQGIKSICPISEDLYHPIDEAARNKGFTLPFCFEDSLPEEPTQVENSDAIPQFDITKIEDFSEPIWDDKGDDKTVIFWDVVDCPFPLHFGPDEIYRRIVSALADGPWGFRGEMTIWAYVDENNNGPWSGEYLRNKTWDSRIYFLPGGDKACRPNRMLNDTLLWEMDCLGLHELNPADVVVVSDHVKRGTHFYRMLEYKAKRHFNVFSVTPTTQHVNKPESFEWPGLLLDEPHYFHPRDLIYISDGCIDP